VSKEKIVNPEVLMTRYLTALLLAALLVPAFVSANDHITPPDPEHWLKEPTDGSMSILFLSLDGMDIPAGAEIACFTPNGVLGGSAVVTGDTTGLAAWGDDGTTQEVDGFHDGEAISFKYWDPVHDWELDVEVELLVGGEVAYHEDEFIVVNGTLGVNDDPGATPVAFALSEIYPTPFNSTARVDFSVDVTSSVKLTVYDLTGREVVTLLDGVIARGRHEVTLDGSGLLSGVYLVALESDNRRMVKRAVLIR
jgi:hypothetical protein